MIIKYYEIKKINLNINKLFLLFGNNEGLKKETTDKIFKNQNQILKYDEKELLDNPNILIENIQTNSLFEDEKKILIKRVTGKILVVLNKIQNENLDKTTIILNSEYLEKKSKLRSLFEKDKKLICIAFYPDNDQTLFKLASNFLQERKILLSQYDINSVVSKCNADRMKLISDLVKIEYYCKNGNKINAEIISKLTNLDENFSVSELVDSCLLNNKRKMFYILNENNFSNDDGVLIIRTFLNKLKKILVLSSEYKINNNIDLTISSAKPAIFWKDKEIIKQQIYQCKPENIKKLIFKLNELEFLIKKNLNNSINLVSDFILNLVSKKTNN
tara:strand:- start:193 stop:1185 length:993 start_codon:yes stop_codon:yes gene_type:complete